ncbi:MAG TPA: class II aldolase/adducin family protein [Thermoanaerobaculia bacterium]|nr:class II aldolase/adducin family protein [Thermoanaerobaculia bacterium]
MSDRFAEARHDVWLHARRMWELGLVAGSAGNVSRRADGDHIAITPTSIPYERLRVEEVTIVELAAGKAVESMAAPSYELPMHRTVYQSRPDVAAIVHTHAPFITTLSVLRRPLPPIIDEMLLHLGGTIEVSEYAFTGTEAVGENVVAALGERAGVILANHGNVCVGRTLERALHAAVVMESCARVYVQAIQIGEPLAIPQAAVTAGLRMYEKRR